VSTPILDGEAPLPAAAARRSGLVPLFVIIAGALFVFVVSLLDVWPRDASGSSSDVSDADTVWFLLAFPAAMLVSVFTHELGHVIAGLAVGFRFRSVRVGPIELGRVNGIRLHRFNTGGYARFGPRTPAGFVPKSLAMILAGPAANIASAALALRYGEGPLLSAVFALSLVAGLLNLMPFTIRGRPTDGALIWRLLTHRHDETGLFAVAKLTDDWMEGALPESLSPDLIADAVELGNRSRHLRVPTRWFAFVHAAYTDKPDESAHHLEACLRSLADLSRTVRQSLVAEAVVFQGQRGRIDLAERWRTDVTVFPPTSVVSLQMDAAILEGRGESASACSKLDEVRTGLLKEPDSPARARNLTLLARWRATLPA
jgi:hypothetical protein